MSTTALDLAARCEAYVREQAASNDPAHDMEHLRRVVGNARWLAAAEGARLEIVIPAAWLHDCVLLPKDSPRRSEASRLAAAEAARLLESWGCDPAWLPGIRHAIEAHSFTARITPETPEAKVVQDADRLEALGAVGLSRTLLLGGHMRKRFYAPDDPFCERRQPDDAVSVLDHFYTKLLHLAKTMQTDAGRAEAARRTVFLQGFLEQLRHEIAR
jgi:uncharacterized protein